MELTTGIAVNVGNLTLDDGGVQEAFIRNPQALGGLVLITFTRFLRGGYGFERGCGYSVVEDPRHCLSAYRYRRRTE